MKTDVITVDVNGNITKWNTYMGAAKYADDNPQVARIEFKDHNRGCLVRQRRDNDWEHEQIALVEMM